MANAPIQRTRFGSSQMPMPAGTAIMHSASHGADAENRHVEMPSSIATAVPAPNGDATTPNRSRTD